MYQSPCEFSASSGQSVLLELLMITSSTGMSLPPIASSSRILWSPCWRGPVCFVSRLVSRWPVCWLFWFRSSPFQSTFSTCNWDAARCPHNAHSCTATVDPETERADVSTTTCETWSCALYLTLPTFPCPDCHRQPVQIHPSHSDATVILSMNVASHVTQSM